VGDGVGDGDVTDVKEDVSDVDGGKNGDLDDDGRG